MKKQLAYVVITFVLLCTLMAAFYFNSLFPYLYWYQETADGLAVQQRLPGTDAYMLEAANIDDELRHALLVHEIGSMRSTALAMLTVGFSLILALLFRSVSPPYTKAWLVIGSLLLLPLLYIYLDQASSISQILSDLT
ncbi:hypothetical protein [Alkalicoccus chagannorensis]|uniref:hypothetical protein n=1 Tax=Alkalicoccus chagannorensis TaxID=427072 RepID=UPI0004153653|nr:hypothetical protein [Alkalicoccus chagannorensis]